MIVKVLCSINNGQYDKGQFVDFPEKQAKRLIEVGAAELRVVPKIIEKAKEVIVKAKDRLKPKDTTSPTTKADADTKGKGKPAKKGR